MKESTDTSREAGEGYRYVSLGFTFAAGTIFFMGMGWLLDRWLGLTPFLTVAGTLVGALLSFVNVYRRLLADERRYSASHPHSKGTKKGTQAP
jgi:F0F1-type ATP synthase assembly protein I